MATGGGDPWKISGEERAKHDAQFFTLKPVNGFITGAQARDFFMQSGLTTQILGQIWTLADMNGDGKMDKLEFSVAMHLIKKKLQGYELPKVLPASLKAAPSPVIGSFGMQAGPMSMGQPVVMGIAPAMNPPMGMPMSGGMMPQASLGTGTMTTGSVGMPLMANGISPAQGMQGVGMGIPPVQSAGASSGWTMPHASKLKYTQLFNSHDRNKRGFLTGVEARGILMQSGLPQPVLAQIWMLSDVDNDGKLTCDEFCIAMHLSDMGRIGRALPPKLPPELVPSKARAGSFGPGSGMAGGMPVSAAVPTPQAVPQQKDSFGDLLGGFGMQQPAPAPVAASGPAAEELEDISPATFEDKRKENFDKGQAELERRRALLQEQMKAEENARLEKERREVEKREKIRLEQEARRQEELQRQLEKQRKLEMERDEQRRKMMEQREQARRDLERQRQMEWERQRKEQLMAEKQREYEQLATLKSQTTDLKGQLESLDGKKSELATKISQVRNGVTDLTSSIESMRVQRDTTLADIDRAERETSDLTRQLAQLTSEKDQLQTQIQTQQNTPLSEAHRTVVHSVELKKTNIQKLRRELQQVERETETKLGEIDNSNVQLKSLHSLVDQLQREIPMLQQKQREAKALQQQQEAEKQAKDRQRQEQAKKELESQRKRENAEAKAKASSNFNDSGGKQDSWFDFNSGGSSSASQGAAMDGDAWSSAFSSATTNSSTGAATDVWGASDPFANQSRGGSDVKKTRYRVLFAFEARSDDELSINAGDEVWVLDVPSEVGMEEWYKGETKTGSIGWFPQAYVEPFPEPATSAFSSQPSSDIFGSFPRRSAFQPVQQTSSHASPSVTGGGDRSITAGGPPVSESSFQPTPGEAHKAPDGLKAQALYQWKARQDNHLSFNKDDIIVVQEQEDMWWMGELGGKIGWFPKAYVKLLETEKTSLSSSQTPSPMGTLEKNSSARASPAQKDGEYYVAMYNYVSGEPTDLIFNEGDMILVTKKDDDWWTGTLGDKSGIFPASYVKKVEIQRSESTTSQESDIMTSTPISTSGVFSDASQVGMTFALGTVDSMPKAPPRRSRSKRGSESDPLFGTDIAQGWTDLSASFSTVSPDVQSAPKAAPRRNRSKKENEAKGTAQAPASQNVDIGSGMIDFGADFSSAFSSKLPSETPSQPHVATAGDPVSAFDTPGNPMSALDIPGNSITAFDTPGNPVSAFDTLGNNVSAFDTHGNPMSAFDTPGNPVSAFDTPGDPVSAFDTPGNPMSSFDTPGNPMSSFDTPGDPVPAVVTPRNPVSAFDTPGNPMSAFDTLENPMPGFDTLGDQMFAFDTPENPMPGFDTPGDTVSTFDTDSSKSATADTQSSKDMSVTASLFDFGANLSKSFPSKVPDPHVKKDIAVSGADSSLEQGVDASNTIPVQNPIPTSDIPPSVSESVNPDFPMDAGNVFASPEQVGDGGAALDSHSSGVHLSTVSPSSTSLFDLDFGSLMSSAASSTIKPNSFLGKKDSSVAVTSSISDISMSNSSSELFAIEHGEANPKISSSMDPLQSPISDGNITSTADLDSLDGVSEPGACPPAAPEDTEQWMHDASTVASVESALQMETADFVEPGQKSAKKPEIARVIAPYTATGNGQLSLEPGNLIHVRQKSPRGWWEGELQARGQRKKIGWFPADYVKPLGSSSARSTPDPKVTLGAGQQASGGDSRSTTPQPQPTVPAPSLPPASAEKLLALYPYTAQNEDELTFDKDAVITVLSRDNPDWWQGEVNGQTGLFPSNYVTPLTQSWLSDSVRHKLSGAEKQRQNYIQELITTEESYNADMSIVLEVFHQPLMEAGVLSEQESENIFVNWNDLIICNKKFLQALRVRKKMCGRGKVILMIGDILCENLPHMTPYVRFCSCQLSAAALLQRKTENQADFVDAHKKCVTNPKAKGMPLSSYLLKPMQRITKYPLLIREIMKYTPPDHADYSNLEDALQRAEELCNQVNEGVRQQENSDRLEWIQRHVICDGLAENITFNSVTNCLGSRKLVHCAVIYKMKSNKELLAFLFNDFLLLTIPPRVLGPSVSVSHLFDSKSKDTYKMYKMPIVLNEILVKKPADPDADPCQFQISHIDRVYHLRATNESERELWVRHIESTSRKFLDTERNKRERAVSLRRVPGVGRLLVVILEGCDLRACDSSGKSDPYCEVSMGSQEHRTRVVNNTLNPKWNTSMQFTIRDLQQDVLCITVYDRDLYSPNDFLGRTEVRVSDVLKEAKLKKGPITKRLILHEVDTGEVIVKLDLQLYES